MDKGYLIINLIYIKELLQEAYRLDTNKSALLDIKSNKLIYLKLDAWCNTVEDKLSLLKIIFRLIEMYPHRLQQLTDNLLCDFSLIENGTEEIYTLYSIMNDLSHLKDQYENQPSWDRYYKKI